MLIRHPREMRYHETDPGTPPPAAVAPVIDAPATDDTAAELERTRAALKQANAESAARRKRLETLEAAEATRAAADLSEADRLKKQLADAQTAATTAQARLNQELIKSAAARAAATLELPFAGSTALDDAVALGAFADLEIGDDGKVSGMSEAIKALHKARPYLFGQQTQPDAPDINARARGGSSPSKEAVIAANKQRLAQRTGGRY